jgi:hypothetical protein
LTAKTLDGSPVLLVPVGREGKIGDDGARMGRRTGNRKCWDAAKAELRVADREGEREREAERDLEEVGQRREVSARGVARPLIEQLPVLALPADGHAPENTQPVNRTHPDIGGVA